MIYYIVFFVLAAFALFEVMMFKEKNPGHAIIYVVSCIFLFFMAATRTNTGYDYGSYRVIFEVVNSFDISVGEIAKLIDYEYLYVWLCRQCSTYRDLLYVIAFISLVPMAILMYAKSEYPITVLLMYYSGIFLTYHMGVMRQGISITICFLAFLLLEKKNYVMFLALALIGFYFHRSGIILFLLIFMGGREFSRPVYYTMLIAAVAYSTIGDSDFILELAQKLPFGSFSEKFAYYQIYAERNHESLFVSIVKRAVIFVFFFEVYKMNGITDRKSYVLLNSYFLSIMIMSFLSSIPVIGGRGTAGLYMAQIMIYPIVIRSFRGIVDKMVVFAIILLLFYSTMKGPLVSFYIPYQSVWFL